MVLDIIIKSFWAGIAALGFAILFNVPRRTLFTIWLLGAIGGLVKFSMLHFNIGIILASFLGASVLAVISVKMAHIQKSPPLIFSIPAVIPMVPGVFAYKMMLGLIALTTNVVSESYNQALMETVNNGVNMMFILISLGTGVAVPMLFTRKTSFKKSKFNKEKPKTV